MGGGIAREKFPDYDIFGKVTIGDWTYVGSNSLIMPGVTVGNRVLVAAGSVVTKSIPDGVVVAGNPAKFVCTTDDFISRNEKYNLGSKGMNENEKKNYLLSQPDDKFIKKGYLII